MKTDYQIVLSDTIQTIEHSTFDGCNIGEIHISKYVRYIEPGAFRDSEVGRFTIDALCSLCISASCGSKLELHLPSTIKRIFYQEWTDECDSIAKIVVPKGQRKRFSRMKNLQELKHIIIEET